MLHVQTIAHWAPSSETDPMCQTHIIKTSYGYFLYSFTEGCRPVSVPRIRNDDDAQTYALWLSRQNKHDEAERFLEAYCASKR